VDDFLHGVEVFANHPTSDWLFVVPNFWAVRVPLCRPPQTLYDTPSRFPSPVPSQEKLLSGSGFVEF
jgi:hypothetical protein